MSWYKRGSYQRRACELIGLSRSVCHYVMLEKDADGLPKQLKELAGRFRRFGSRRAHAMLERKGWKVNKKRVRRLWRSLKLQVKPQKRRKRF